LTETGTAKDDRLPVIEVGRWAEDKHKLVSLYDRLFSTGMKRKWDTRVYIDLYSGPGIVRFSDGRLMWGSPLLAMAVPDPFDVYIFCEREPSFAEALKIRAESLFPHLKTKVISGDCNEGVEQICSAIPVPSKGRSVLSLCFLDPYDLSINFSTVQRIGRSYVDFLVLLALYMDANRNYSSYIEPINRKIEKFLGMKDWRALWTAKGQRAANFPQFLAECYSKQMEGLGYLPVRTEKMKLVRSREKNLPLYRIALFSRHEQAYRFWDEVLKYSTRQQTLDFPSEA